MLKKLFAPNLIRFSTFSSTKMALSRFEYVKKFEQSDDLLRGCWIVVRIDGKGFHKFSDQHNFIKPNDKRSLDLMSQCAKVVMKEFQDIFLAYGQSDEYSFVLRKETNIYSRRSSKITTNIVSLFASAFVFHWKDYFESQNLSSIPAFDARAVLYPTDETLRDYLSWRQADCHINNLFNTTFWSLIQKGGKSNKEAEEKLKGTLAKDKNEILFSDFGINYNNEPEQFRKGTTLLKAKKGEPPVTLFCDIIGDDFWNLEYPDLLKVKINNPQRNKVQKLV